MARCGGLSGSAIEKALDYNSFELRNSFIVIPACQQAEPESRFYLNFLDSRLGRE